jgi:peptidoglycan/xylan/chitin deacetylase (PgdA/CDA1 family)
MLGGENGDIEGNQCDPVLMQNVRMFAETNGMRIVLSTDHRNDPQDKLQDTLEPYIPWTLLHEDYKTRVKGPRHKEVQDWLDRNGNPDYLILDDWAMLFENATPEMLTRFIEVPYMTGFDNKTLYRAQNTWSKLQVNNTPQ